MSGSAARPLPCKKPLPGWRVPWSGHWHGCEVDSCCLFHLKPLLKSSWQHTPVALHTMERHLFTQQGEPQELPSFLKECSFRACFKWNAKVRGLSCLWCKDKSEKSFKNAGRGSENWKKQSKYWGLQACSHLNRQAFCWWIFTQALVVPRERSSRNISLSKKVGWSRFSSFVQTGG